MPEFPTFRSEAGSRSAGLIKKTFPNLKLNTKTPCLRCPHRGTPLNGVPQKDGKIVCPAHGLCFDMNTGGMIDIPLIPRTTPAE
jgi:hypothetical protein